MNLILLGAPGAGKGTQAELISQRLSVPTISTGNILREAIKNGTELGTKAKSFMDEGELVPDEVIIGIIKQRLAQEDCRGGFILDGVPRTVAQAEALKTMGIGIDYAINIDVRDEQIIERMSGRRVCSKCAAPYHLRSNPPKAEGVCDKCGAVLITRDDDLPDTVRERLHVYHAQTEPLIEYYQKAGKLRTVDGSGDITDITRAIFAAIEGRL